MSVADDTLGTPEKKLWGLFQNPFRQKRPSAGRGGGGGFSSANSSSLIHHQHHLTGGQVDPTSGSVGSRAQQSTGGVSVSSVTRSLLPKRRRLRLDPSNKLYFPYEPGKQVKSAIRIKNTSKSHVAFKTVFKFVEHPENNEKPLLDQKNKVKFKIMSLKVKGPMEYVPELFDEHKDLVSVEQILKVVFLDVERSASQLEKLKRQLAEAEAALEARKKPAEESGPRIVGEGLVIDEWKERRERYLAKQQVEGSVDSA
ncbi:Vesicle-associated protein 4-1 [Platanthera guangdongensis]|uniref:Vesicle-associated protein 4-1 n=1 Tax=Platanthera guangdongensis TaxID=2320717 RepID=A0ABR2LWY2_9ASPA